MSRTAKEFQDLEDKIRSLECKHIEKNTKIVQLEKEILKIDCERKQWIGAYKSMVQAAAFLAGFKVNVKDENL